jgi:hypothetical protein
MVIMCCLSLVINEETSCFSIFFCYSVHLNYCLFDLFLIFIQCACVILFNSAIVVLWCFCLCSVYKNKPLVCLNVNNLATLCITFIYFVCQ